MKRLILSTVCMLFCATGLLAQTLIDGIYYNLDESTLTASVTNKARGDYSGSNSYSGSITIPSTVVYNGTSYSVTNIGSNAFSGCSGLTNVTIPNSVTFIGNYAFYNCTGLTSVTIPNSVTSIGGSAFYYCRGLTSIEIPNSVTSIGNDAFSGVKNVIYTGSATGSPWGAIAVNGFVDGDFVFSDDAKTRLEAYIGKGGDVTIPNSVTSIGYSAFYYCRGLTSIEIPNSVTSIGSSAFSYCTGLTEITIPNSATSIANDAFWGCNNIETADINSQAALNAITFTNKLASIVLGDKITSIGDFKFRNCTSLTSVIIPSSVTNIGDSAFVGCSGLTEIICEGETPAGSNTIFGEGGEAGKIYVKALLKVPSQWFKLYKVTEPWCRFDMTASDFDMVVIPYENKAVFTWTPITGAEAYELTVIEKETGEALCSLNFDAYGRLRGLVLRNDSEKTYVGGYDFTVTSLRGDVEYDYTMNIKDINDNVIESMNGTFRTDGGLTTAAPEAEAEVFETARYDINGRPLNAPIKGVNIVKYSDGSVEKELVR